MPDRVGHAGALPNPVRTGIRAEVGVEGAVLLHDHDHVPDLVDPRERVGGGAPAATRRQGNRGGRQHECR